MENSYKAMPFYATFLALTLASGTAFAQKPYDYTIKKGDSLFQISRKQEIPLDELLRCNSGLTRKSILRPGQKIRLLASYRVEPGDSLSKIASKYGMELTEILRYNPSIKDQDEIMPGQEIAVYCKAQAARPEQKEEPEQEEKEQKPKKETKKKKIRFPSGLELAVVTDKKLVGAGGVFYDPLQSGIPLLELSRKDLYRQVSPHFSVAEFASLESERCMTPAQRQNTYRMGGDTYLRFLRLDPKLVEKLERLRQGYGSLPINSGYRPLFYNNCVGGARRSMHQAGKAADIGVPGRKLKRQAEKLFSPGGVGIGPTITHVDTRKRTNRWRY